ncbi:uncharacterized protein G2W53_030419 [Senna tora]|uniref:Uncharacterized protein n=1 Tax=Senna tora TaxID=362788 RepID=A0A834T7E6_9FABA|nr:uncharacterized protein G2W53_030419 [Senna tora]
MPVQATVEVSSDWAELWSTGGPFIEDMAMAIVVQDFD